MRGIKTDRVGFLVHSDSMNRAGIDNAFDATAICGLPNVIGPDDVGLQDVIPSGLISDCAEMDHHIGPFDDFQHRIKTGQIGLHIGFAVLQRADIINNIG